jgi:NTE family protein
MSIPLIFPPVDWGGRPLVDGGVVNNLPVGVARELGAAVVVAVEVGSPPLEPAEYRSALGVASRVNDILGRRRNADFAQPADVHLRPELGRHSFRDYSSFDRLIQLGYQAAQQGVPEIRRRLAASGAAEAAAEQAPRDGPRLEGTPIAQVAVRGNERLSERLVRRTFNIPLGRSFELKKGLRAFDKVPATGLVDQAWMEFEPAPQGLRIGLRIQEAAPNRAEVGGAYTEWEKARGVLRLRNRNTLGFGEETELLLAGSSAESLFSLTLRGDRLFLAGLGYRLGAFAGEDRPRFFDDSGDVINRAQFERRGIDVTLRAGLERWGLVEAGLRVGRVKTVPTAGIDVVAGSDQVRSLVAAVTVDDLDDLLWPRTGERLVLTGEWSLQELGATRESWRAAADARAARGLGGRVILQLDARLGASGGDLPVYDHFRLGGPYLVPGYRHEELLGPQALAGALSLHCRAVGALRAFVRAGAGNAFETTDEVGLDALRWGAGLGLMHPTPLGPVSLELGVNEGGRALVTLSLGWN